MSDTTILRDGKPFHEFRRLLPKRPTIVEVGAHDGTTAAGFLRVFPEARICAFEPDPRVAARFKARQFPPSVTLAESAIGDRDGTTTFHQSSGTRPGQSAESDHSGSILEPIVEKQPEWLRFESKITVPIRCLDDVLPELGITGTIDLLWADVQGAELAMLAGGANTLRNTRFAYLEWGVVEQYRGQPSLAALSAALSAFEVEELMRHDVLYRNKSIPPVPRHRRYLLPHALGMRSALARSPIGPPLQAIKRMVQR